MGKSISSSKAYEIIRILNLELEEKNILTIRVLSVKNTLILGKRL